MEKYFALILVAFLFIMGCTKTEPICGNQICEKGEGTEACPEDCLVERSENIDELTDLIKKAKASPGSFLDSPELSIHFGENISLKQIAVSTGIESSQLCYSPGDLYGKEKLNLSIEYIIESRAEEKVFASAICEKGLLELKEALARKKAEAFAFDPERLKKCNCLREPCCALVFRSREAETPKGMSEPAPAIKPLPSPEPTAQKGTPEETPEEILVEDIEEGEDIAVRKVWMEDYHLGHYFEIAAEIEFHSQNRSSLKNLGIEFSSENEEGRCSRNTTLDLKEGITVVRGRTKGIYCNHKDPGKYLISVSVSPGEADTNAENNSMNIEFTVPEEALYMEYPDLVVSHLSASPSTGIEIGQPFVIDYRIKNEGQVEVMEEELIEVKLYAGNHWDTAVTPYQSLQPGEETEILSYYARANTEITPFLNGNITRIRAEADPENKVKEEEEENNEMIIEVGLVWSGKEYCLDYDKGLLTPALEINSKCYDSYKRTNIYDECSSNYTIREAECINNKCFARDINCIERGYGGCFNKTCYEGTMCFDKDEDMGEGSYENPSACYHKERLWRTDRCKDTILNEAVCEEDRCISIDVDCLELGFAGCYDGACIKATPTPMPAPSPSPATTPTPVENTYYPGDTITGLSGSGEHAGQTVILRIDNIWSATQAEFTLLNKDGNKIDGIITSKEGIWLEENFTDSQGNYALASPVYLKKINFNTATGEGNVILAVFNE